jgi:hypothetical protein
VGHASTDENKLTRLGGGFPVPELKGQFAIEDVEGLVEVM